MATKAQKPLKVQEAMNSDDKAALSVMGKAGAKARVEKEFWRDLSQEQIEERNLADAAAHADTNRIGWDDDYRP